MKGPDFLYYILRWLGGFCDIIDGLFLILTGGFYSPYISFKLVVYSSKRTIGKKIDASPHKGEYNDRIQG